MSPILLKISPNPIFLGSGIPPLGAASLALPRASPYPVLSGGGARRPGPTPPSRDTVLPHPGGSPSPPVGAPTVDPIREVVGALFSKPAGVVSPNPCAGGIER